MQIHDSRASFLFLSQKFISRSIYRNFRWISRNGIDVEYVRAMKLWNLDIGAHDTANYYFVYDLSDFTKEIRDREGKQYILSFMYVLRSRCVLRSHVAACVQSGYLLLRGFDFAYLVCNSVWLRGRRQRQRERERNKERKRSATLKVSDAVSTTLDGFDTMCLCSSSLLIMDFFYTQRIDLFLM